MTEKQSSTVGEQSKRAAVFVGRFQPPTAGHYAMMDTMKKFIRDNPKLQLEAVPLVVVIEGKETSKDKKRNPLTGDERVNFMMGSGKADGVKFLKAGSAYDAFEACRKCGYEPIAVAAGQDRGENYLSMLDKYFKTVDGEPIEHELIELPRTMTEAEKKTVDQTAQLDDLLRYMDDDLPVHMISASLARHAVTKDERMKFATIVGLKKKPKLANLMFDKIKTAMMGNTE